MYEDGRGSVNHICAVVPRTLLPSGALDLVAEARLSFGWAVPATVVRPQLRRWWVRKRVLLPQAVF